MARFDIAETIDCWLLFFGVGCYSVSFQSFELFSNCTARNLRAGTCANSWKIVSVSRLTLPQHQQIRKLPLN